MSETFQKKSAEIKKIFAQFSSLSSCYEAMIEMGRKLPPFSDALKIPENLVTSCQSRLYLASHLRGGLVFFEATSDALISAGLAALLIAVYGGETPEVILTQSPH